jgi:O-antigen/teichoic acid export membrane protein
MLAFVNYRMDIYFVNFFLTPVASGLYAVAVKLGERMWLLSQAVSTVIFPRLSALKNSDAKKRDITPIASRIVLLFTGILCLLVASFANYIIPVLFGQEFAKAVLPLLILLPGIAVLASSRIVANDFAARGKPEWNLYISVPVTVINLVGNIILIPTYGLIGAAIATTIAYTIRFIAVTAVYSVVTRQSPLTLLVVTKSDIKLIASSLRKNYGS